MPDDPFFLVRYRQTGDATLRDAKRPAHIAYRKALGDRLILAGPILDDAGTTPAGSVIILRAGTRDEAEQIAMGDPFVVAGLLTLTSLEAIRIMALTPPR